MTYSFSFTAANKESAIDTAYEKLNNIQDADPVHTLDAPAVRHVVAELIDALGDSVGSVSVSCSGWVNYRGTGDTREALSINTQVQVTLSPGTPPRAE